MKFFRQLGLLLKQNLLERQRHPIFLLVEIIWPLAVVIVFVVIRKEFAAPLVSDCNYAPRSLPSAGTMVFIQSFMCSIGGRHCITSSTDSAKRSSKSSSNSNSSSSSSLTQVLTSFGQLVSENFETVQKLPMLLPRSVSLLTQLGASINNSQSLKDFRAINLTLRAFLKDPDAVGMLLNAAGVPADVGNVVLSSTIDLTNLYRLLSYGEDAGTILCHLGRHLLLPPESTDVQLSQILCSLNGTQAASLGAALLEQVSIVSILNTAADLAQTFGEPSIAEDVTSISIALEKSSDVQSTRRLQTLYNQMSKLYSIVPDVEAFVQNLNDTGGVALYVMAGAADNIVESLNSLLGNSSEWNKFFGIWSFGKTMLSIFTGTGMTSATEATLPFTDAFSSSSHILDLLRQVYDVTGSFISGLYSSDVVLTKVIRFLGLFPSSNASIDSCKVAMAFWDMFVLPRNSTAQAQLQVSVEDIIKAACSKNDATFYLTAQFFFNLAGLLNETKALDHSKGGDIVEVPTGIFDSVKTFYNQYESILRAVRSLNYETLWQATQLIFVRDSLQQSDGLSLMNQVADIAQKVLSSAGYGDAIRLGLRFTDLHCDAILAILENSEVLVKYLSNELQSGGLLNELWNSITPLNTSDSLATLLTILDVVADRYSMVSRDSNGSLLSNDSMLLCHSMVGALRIALPQYSLSAFQSLVCQQNVSVIQNAASQAFSLKPVEDSFAALLRAYTVPATPDNPESNSSLNASNVLTKLSTIVERLSQLQFSFNWTNTSLHLSPMRRTGIERSLLLYTLQRQAGAACDMLVSHLPQSGSLHTVLSQIVAADSKLLLTDVFNVQDWLTISAWLSNQTAETLDLDESDSGLPVAVLKLKAVIFGGTSSNGNRTCSSIISGVTKAISFFETPLEPSGLDTWLPRLFDLFVGLPNSTVRTGPKLPDWLHGLTVSMAMLPRLNQSAMLSMLLDVLNTSEPYLASTAYGNTIRLMLAYSDLYLDVVTSAFESVIKAFAFRDSLIRLWTLLPEQQKYDILLIQASLVLGSELPAMESAVLCNLTSTLNYTSVQGYRDALQALFCQKNVSAFASYVISALNEQPFIDNLLLLQTQGLTAAYRSWPPASGVVSSGFNLARFVKKAMSAAEAIPVLINHVKASWTLLQQATGLIDWRVVPGQLAWLGYRLYQLEAAAMGWNSAHLSSILSRSSNDSGVHQAHIMRRSANDQSTPDILELLPQVLPNMTIVNKYILTYLDQIQSLANGSLQFNSSSIRDSCSNARADTRLSDLTTHAELLVSFTKVYSALQTIAKAGSVSAQLTTMTCYLLQADFVQLLNSIGNLDLTQAIMMVTGQESAQAAVTLNITSNICDVIVNPLTEAVAALNQMDTAVRGCSLTGSIPPLLRSNLTLQYLRSMTEALRLLDSIIHSIISIDSPDTLNLLVLLSRALIDYAVQPSSRAILSYILSENQNFTQALSSKGHPADEIAKLLDSTVNVETMMLLSGFRPALVDHTACASAEALLSLFASAEFNVTSLYKALCHQPGPPTFSSLVRSLNYTRMEQLETKKPLSILLVSLSATIKSLSEVINGTNLTELASPGVDFMVRAHAIQRIALPPAKKKISDLSQLAFVFMDDLQRVIPYVEDSSLRHLSPVLQSIVSALSSFVDLQDHLKIAVQLKDLFTNDTTLLGALITVEKLTPDLAQAVLEQYLDISVLLFSVNSSVIEELVCSPLGLSDMLRQSSWPTNVSIDGVRHLLCEFNPALAAEMSASVQQRLLPQSLNAQILQMAPERILGSAGSQLLNDARSLLPLQQFFTRAYAVLSNTRAAFSLPMDALGIVDPSTGSAFVYPEQLASLAAAFCGEPYDMNSLDTTVTSYTRIKRSFDEDYEEFMALPSEVCQALMLLVRQKPYGKVIWAFIKPLLAGKILYTPQNNFTDTIIQKANRTFVEALQIVEFFRFISAGIHNSTLTDQSKLKSARAALNQEALNDPLIQRLLSQSFSFDPSSLDQMLTLFGQDSNATRILLQLSSIITQAAACISFNRFEGVQSENELVSRAQLMGQNRTFLAGVVFLDGANQHDVHYKIRMNRDQVPSTLTIQEAVYTPDPLDNYLSNLKYLQGFIQLQDMIEQGIIDVLSGSVDNPLTRPALELRQMPAPCYRNDTFKGIMYPYMLLLIVGLGWLCSVAHSIKTLVYYKDTGLDEALKLVSVRNRTIWTAWFINNFILMLVISGITAVIVVYLNIMRYSNPMILFLYLATFSLSTLAFCFLISSFFTKANLAATLGAMVYILSMLPFAASITWSNSVTQGQQMAICIFSGTSFAIGAEQIMRWEQLSVGVQWSNVADSPGFDRRSVSTQWAFVWMLIDTAVYFILGWYFSNVVPSKYGSPRPWYFLISPSFWRPEGCARKRMSFKSYTLPALAEDEFYSYVVGISMQNLSKKFKSKSAVCDLTLDFYEGQVTAFLGKNGAGKTTTIHLLTGIRTPSSGSAYINGMDIATDMESIRSTLGFCPQFDMLFDYMTVKEHLYYFAELKGDRQGLSAKMLLHDIGLEHVANELVANVSGGLRRRLSVALAFCGNSKTIILDEPTSSIDPSGRRAIWDVILKYRADRTIVLCTHHLDEAELIADRVAIMKEGKLLCTGSPMALKRQHSCGHELLIEMKQCLAGTINDGSTYPTATIMDFVKSHLPSAELAHSDASRLAYKLHLEDRHRYGELCIALDRELDCLGISCYTITDCSLEEVFLTVTRESVSVPLSGTDLQPGTASLECSSAGPSTAMVAAAATIREETTTPNAAPTLSSALALATDSANSAVPAVSESRKLFLRLRALFKKRLYHHARTWKAFVMLIVLPCLFVGLAAMVSSITPDENDLPELALQSSLYPGSYVFFKDSTSRKLLQDSLLGGSWMNTPCLLQGQLNNSSPTCEPLYTAQHSVCAAIPDALPSCPCDEDSQCTDRTPAVDEWSAGSDDVLQRVCDAYNMDDYLYSTNLLDQYKGKRLGGWTMTDPDAANTSAGATVATTWFDNRAYHAMPMLLNGFNNVLLRSRSSELHDASISVSNHPITLSVTSINFSTVVRAISDSCLAMFLLIAFSFVPAGLFRYTVGEHLLGEKQQQALCGLSTGVYWLAAIVWDMLAFTVTIGLTIAVLAAFGIKAYVARYNAAALAPLLILYAWAALSFTYMFVRAFKDTVTAFFGMLLFNIFIGMLLTTAFLLLSVIHGISLTPTDVALAANVCLIVPQYALTAGLVQLTVNELQADVLDSFGISSYVNPLYLLRWDYVALALEGLVFLSVTLLVEWCHAPRKCHRPRSSRKMESLTADDEDVAAERTRALSCNAKEQAVVLRDVSKLYPGLRHWVTAVDSVSFAVSPGECFGMLGVNGAGKTTTFGMMTGTIGVSSGDIYILGQRISGAGARPVIGYCPQANALDGKLTGREMLHFYGSLRGIAPDELEKEIDRLTEALCMETFVARRTGKYSGGMKRTLSVALAMLGRPSLVFLDEPTAGMDPHARQIVWRHVRAYIASGGSVILTSHSMSECDQLCHRIAIMVNGRFSCIGSPQHLKSRYADGHTVKMKLKGTKISPSDIISFMEQHFAGPKLMDQHTNSLEFFLPTSSAKLGELYTTIERARQRLEITDYAIFQTTLDQVFIRFARDQVAQPSSQEGEANEAFEAV